MSTMPTPRDVEFYTLVNALRSSLVKVTGIALAQGEPERIAKIIEDTPPGLVRAVLTLLVIDYVQMGSVLNPWVQELTGLSDDEMRDELARRTRERFPR